MIGPTDRLSDIVIDFEMSEFESTMTPRALTGLLPEQEFLDLRRVIAGNPSEVGTPWNIRSMDDIRGKDAKITLDATLDEFNGFFGDVNPYPATIQPLSRHASSGTSGEGVEYDISFSAGCFDYSLK